MYGFFNLLGFERPVKDTVGARLECLPGAGPGAAGYGEEFGLLDGRQQCGHADDVFGAGQVEVDDKRGAAAGHHQLERLLAGGAFHHLDFELFEGGPQRLKRSLVLTQYRGRFAHVVQNTG